MYSLLLNQNYNVSVNKTYGYNFYNIENIDNYIDYITNEDYIKKLYCSIFDISDSSFVIYKNSAIGDVELSTLLVKKDIDSLIEKNELDSSSIVKDVIRFKLDRQNLKVVNDTEINFEFYFSDLKLSAKGSYLIKTLIRRAKIDTLFNI